MDPRFLDSSRAEIQGLLDRGTYIVVNQDDDVPPGATILKSRVIHSIKTDSGGIEKFKTRLVIQGHLDPEEGRVVSKTPTILRSSTRIILSMASTLRFKFWSRELKQAFIQWEDLLHWELYVKPPKRPDLLAMIDQPPGLLQAVKPLYVLAESPGYWWQTFKRYHIADLSMTQTIFDPCFFFKKKEIRCYFHSPWYCLYQCEISTSNIFKSHNRWRSPPKWCSQDSSGKFKRT